MTAATVRQWLVWVLRIALYGLLAALLLRQCQGDDSAAATGATTADPVARQAECYENSPPLFYDDAGNCFSADPTGLTAEDRAAIAVVPTPRCRS